MQAEILSKLLPKSAALEIRSPVTGEIYTSSDCALGLGLMQGEEVLANYGRLSVLGQAEYVQDIVDYVYTSMKNDWSRQKLYKKHTCRPGLLTEMIYIAIAEEVAPNNKQRRCGLCKGQGERMISDELIQCSRCGGIGRKVWSEKEIAAQLGVGIATFRRAWQRPYNQILDILRSLNASFFYELNQVFRAA